LFTVHIQQIAVQKRQTESLVKENKLLLHFRCQSTLTARKRRH